MIRLNQYLTAVATVSGLTLLTNLLGFGREILVAREFGAGADADAFLAAFTIVSALFLIFTAGTVQSAMMPRYQFLLARGDSGTARGLLVLSGIVLAAVLLALTASLLLASHWWVSVFLPGFFGDRADLTAALVRWMGPMVLFTGLGVVLQSVCHAHMRFLAPASVPLLNNFIAIVFLLSVVPLVGIVGLAWAALAGSLMWWVVLVPLVATLAPRGPAEDVRPHLVDVMWRVGPLLILLGVDQLSALVQKTLVSGLEVGSIAALHYGAKLSGLPIGIFSAAIATVVFPVFVDALSRRDRALVGERFLTGLSGVFLLAAPATAFIIVEATAVVHVLFERGAFDALATQRTAAALAWYAIGIVPQSLIILLNRVYFAAEDTKTPMIVGVFAAFAQMALCWAAVQTVGYVGIAIGTTAYAAIYAALLPVRFGKILDLALLTAARAVWRSVAGAACMAVVLSVLPMIRGLVGLLISIAIGAAVYVLTLVVLREPLLRQIFYRAAGAMSKGSTGDERSP